MFSATSYGGFLIRHLDIVEQVVHLFLTADILCVFFYKPGTHLVLVLTVSVDVFPVGLESEAIVGLQLAFLVVQ